MPRPVSIFEPPTDKGIGLPVLPPPPPVARPVSAAPRALEFQPSPFPGSQQPTAKLMVPDRSHAPLPPLATPSPIQPEPAPALQPAVGPTTAPDGEGQTRPPDQAGSPSPSQVPAGTPAPQRATQGPPISVPTASTPAPATGPQQRPEPLQPRDPLGSNEGNRRAVSTEVVVARPMETPAAATIERAPAPVVHEQAPAPPPGAALRPQIAVMPPARSPRPLAHRLEETAMTQPTIHVTIGRVEVRATPPPAPSQKKGPSKPAVMSLDEYLRQRNGGGPP